MKILSNPNLSDEFIPTLNYSYYKSNGQLINKIDQNLSLLNSRYFEHNDEHDDDVTNEDDDGDDDDREDSNRMHTTTSTSINTNNKYNHSNNNQVIIEEIWKACLRQHMIHPQRLSYIQQELKTIESIQNYHESFYIESSYHESSYFESLHERIVSLGRFILMEVAIMFGLHYIINDYITYPEYSNMSTLQFFVIDIQKIYEWAIIGYSINDNNNINSSSNDVMGDDDRNYHNIVDDSSNDDNDDNKSNNSYSSLKQSIEKILKMNLKILIQSLLQPSKYKINKIQLTQNILYIHNVCHCLNNIVLLLIDRKIKTMIGPNQILYNLFDDYDVNNDHNDDSSSNSNRNTERNIDIDDDDRVMNKVVYDLIDEIKLELFSYKHEISCLLQITTILKELLFFCILSSSSSSSSFNFSSLLINSDSNNIYNHNSGVIGSSDDYDSNNNTQLSSFYQYIHHKKLYFSTHLCYLPSLLRGELIIEELKNKLKNSSESSSFSNYNSRDGNNHSNNDNKSSYESMLRNNNNRNTNKHNHQQQQQQHSHRKNDDDDDDNDNNMKWHQNFIEIKNNNQITYNSNDQIQLLENSLYDMILLPFKIMKIQIIKKKQQLKNKFKSSGNNRNCSSDSKDISVQISQSIVLYYLLDFFYLSIINNNHHHQYHQQLLPQLKNFIINLGNCFHLHPKIINSIFTIWQIDVTFDVNEAIENILLSSSSSSSITTTTSTILQDIDILTAIIKRLLCSNQLLSCHHLISCLTSQQHPFIYSNIGILAKVSCIYRVDLWQVR